MIRYKTLYNIYYSSAMTSFVRNLLVIIFLVGIVAGATLYSESIKTFVLSELSSSGSQVLGANTQELKKYSVSKQVNAEITNTLNAGRKQLMQVKIGDIVNSFSQAQKIVHDVSSLQQAIRQQLQNLAK